MRGGKEKEAALSNWTVLVRMRSGKEGKKHHQKKSLRSSLLYSTTYFYSPYRVGSHARYERQEIVFFSPSILTLCRP